MHAIYAYINPQNHPNVGIYSIHGVPGFRLFHVVSVLRADAENGLEAALQSKNDKHLKMMETYGFLLKTASADELQQLQVEHAMMFAGLAHMKVAGVAKGGTFHHVFT